MRRQKPLYILYCFHIQRLTAKNLPSAVAMLNIASPIYVIYFILFSYSKTYEKRPSSCDLTAFSRTTPCVGMNRQTTALISNEMHAYLFNIIHVIRNAPHDDV